TPAACLLREGPSASAASRGDAFENGRARAPRAVFRALAEHIGCRRPEHLVCGFARGTGRRGRRPVQPGRLRSPEQQWEVRHLAGPNPTNRRLGFALLISSVSLCGQLLAAEKAFTLAGA